MALEDIGFDDGKVSESSSEGSEEDQQRVRDNAKKAKQVKAQIQKVQKQNKQFAAMLTLLLQLINDDILLGMVFKQLIDHQVSIPAIFAQFLPFLQHKIDIEIYKNMYGVLWEKLPREENLVNLVARLGQVKASSGSLQAIEIGEYVHFVIRYLHRYEVVDWDKMDKEKRKEFHGKVKKELER